jgi:hypothetical protein
MKKKGFFIGDVTNKISAAISADLGEFLGSIAAALGLILVPLVQQKLNWFFCILSIHYIGKSSHSV